MKNFKFIFIFIISVSIVTVGYFVLNNYLSSNKLTVEYSNINSVAVINEDLPEKTVVTITKSGESVRLPKGEYILKYTANNGYQSGESKADIQTQDAEVKLEPSYSRQKLDSMLPSELTQIQTSIQQQIKGVGQYIVQNGKLYGRWA